MEGDALVLRAFCAQIRRPGEGAADAEVGVAVETAGDREQLGPGERLLIVLEALGLRPRRDLRDQLGAERFLRGRALVREHAHREHDQDRRDDRHRPPGQPALGTNVDERHRDQQHETQGRDADRAEDHRRRPFEDPQQVEEEVEVPVGPRDEVDRSRIGRSVEQLAEPAGSRAGVIARRRVLPDDRQADDHHDDDQRHDRVVEHRVREERLPALLHVGLVLLVDAAALGDPIARH